MQDIFKEQIIRKKPSTLEILGAIVLSFVYFVLAILIDALITLTIGIQGAFVVLLAAAVYATYLTIGRLKIEYEYSVTNDELDIDMIVNRKSRKRVLSVRLKEVEVMAHQTKLDKITTVAKTKDFSSHRTNDTYTFVSKQNKGLYRIVFEPNADLLEAIGKKMSRSKLHIK